MDYAILREDNSHTAFEEHGHLSLLWTLQINLNFFANSSSIPNFFHVGVTMQITKSEWGGSIFFCLEIKL